MEYEVNKGVSKTELSVKGRKEATFDEFRYRMLKENAIEGILSCVRGQVNEETFYTYDITGMQSLAMQFEGKKFTYAQIKELYHKIITTLLKSEEYFLDKNCFLLSEELIQYEEATGTYHLLYCPESGREMKSQLTDFTEYIVNHTEYSDKQAVALIYEVFKMMRDEHTTILEILSYIKEGKKQSKLKVAPQMQQVPGKAPVMGVSPSLVRPDMPQRMEPSPVVEKKRTPVENPFEEKKVEKSKQLGISTRKVLLCAGTVTAGVGAFLILYLCGVLFISHTNRLDLSKFGGVLVILFAMVFYGCYKIVTSEEEVEDVPKESIKKEKQTKEKSKKKKTKNESKRTQEAPGIQKPLEMPENQPVKPAVIQQSNNIQPNQPCFQMPERRSPRYRLIAEKEKNAQQFVLHKFPYLLGKSYGQVDGVIYSEAVSKVHAEFVEEEGALYLFDMSSTNGTFVNSKRITSNEKVAVKCGDHIRLANQEYVLSM